MNDAIDYIKLMWDLVLQGEGQGIVFFFGVCFALVSAYMLINQLRIMRWPTVKGELLEAGVQKRGFTEMQLYEQEYVNKVLYKYEVAGKKYTSDSLSFIRVNESVQNSVSAKV